MTAKLYTLKYTSAQKSRMRENTRQLLQQKRTTPAPLLLSQYQARVTAVPELLYETSADPIWIHVLDAYYVAHPAKA